MRNFNIKKISPLKSIFFSTVLLIATSCMEEDIPNSSEKEIESPSELIDLTSSSESASTVDTSRHKEHDFDDRNLGPFTEDQGFSGSALSGEGMSFQNDYYGGKRLKIVWKESEYDGSRRERGHEIKLNVNDNKEVYCGFYFFTPSGQSNNLLNKNTIIWQLYNWNTDGCSNWTAHLELKNNDLYLSYRSACVTANEIKILDNIETDKQLAFQIRSVLSGNNRGNIYISLDGKTIADVKNINLGFGSFDSNDKAKTSVAGVKMGMYCADTGNYTNNETRIIYLENVGSCNRIGSIGNSLKLIDPRNM